MKYSIEIKEEAFDDISDAFEWYEGERSGLGIEFLDHLNSYFEKLTANPSQFSLFERNLRAAFLQRFPFRIIYEIQDTSLIVYAVYHTSRNPKKLKKRK